MNNFDKYVKKSRDCSPDLLDAAIAEGMRKAQNNRLDPRKFVHLGLALAVTLAAIFITNAMPLEARAAGYLENPIGRRLNVNFHRNFFNDIDDRLYRLD